MGAISMQMTSVIEENRPKIVAQETIDRNGGQVDRFTIKLKAANKIVARQRARAWMRRKFPTIRNIIRPEIESEDTFQSTFNDIVPETIERKEFTVEVLALR